MYYQSTGQGQPFIFQHGLGANLQQAQGLLAELDTVQLITMDCPGHGQAPLPDGQPPSFTYYARQIIRLMEKLDTGPAIIGGISMGAGIALQVALLAPERVRALVLVRPAWIDQPSPSNLAILTEAARFIHQEQGQTRFQQRADFQHIAARLPLAAASILGVFAETQRPEIPLVLQSMVNDQPFAQLQDLATIVQPCLVIANDDDPLHPLELAETIHRHLPNSQIQRVVSRYLNNDQHTKTVYSLVAKFIQAI
jgi:pimeloyl-ACP methyl ester carboxylesterase